MYTPVLRWIVRAPGWKSKIFKRLKMTFFLFYWFLGGRKDRQCTWFGSKRCFVSLKMSIFTWFFVTFDISAWKKSKKKKSPITLFFCFLGVFWDREKGECSWFGLKLCFYSLKTSIFRWFISKCTNLHYFRSKVAEKKTRMSLDLCGHQKDD